jgi:hypothetical protein
VKILVACHKLAKVYQDDIYTPIQVGKALHPDLDLGYITDATGDSISAKNPMFCELTAIYWAWKNLHDVEYIGLCHYRRYFDTVFTSTNIHKIFKKADVILCSPLPRKYPMLIKLERILSCEDVIILFKVIKKLYPEYEKTVIDYLWGYKDYPYNMLVCKKEIFDSYSKWLFNILFTCEHYMHTPSYTCSKRIFGYIGEFLLPIYFIYNKYKIHTIDITSYPGNKVQKIGMKACMMSHIRELLKFRHMPQHLEETFDSSIIAGLKADGIEL